MLEGELLERITCNTMTGNGIRLGSKNIINATTWEKTRPEGKYSAGKTQRTHPVPIPFS